MSRGHPKSLIEGLRQTFHDLIVDQGFHAACFLLFATPMLGPDSQAEPLSFRPFSFPLR